METLSKKAEKSESKVSPALSWPLYELHSACMQNAIDLKEEAQLLLLAKRYARATALAVHAIEELGKAHIVADSIDGCASEEEFENAFKRHDLKAAYVGREVHLELGQEDGNSRPITGGTITYDLKKGAQLGSLRLDSIYVSWDGSKPITPSENINAEIAEKVVGYATKCIDGEVRMQYLTERIGTRSQYK